MSSSRKPRSSNLVFIRSVKSAAPSGGVFDSRPRKARTLRCLARSARLIFWQKRGPVGVWQRYEEATMCQRRPADPTDPGDAADLSIMGYSTERCGCLPSCPHRLLFLRCTFAQQGLKINSFLTTPAESVGLR